MKFLKPVILGMFVASAMVSTAQEEHSHETPAEKAKTCSSKLTETYGLNQDQSSTVEAAQLDFHTTVRKIKQDESITGEVKKAQITAAKTEMNSEIKTVLSEEQYTEYIEACSKKATAHKKKMKDNRTPESMAKHKAKRLASKLSNVTDAQQAQMEELFLKVAQKIEAVKANESLTKDQKIEFTKGNRTDGQNALRTILTAEQLVEFDELKASHKAAHDDTKDAEIEIK